jgi:hypothetical protein
MVIVSALRLFTTLSADQAAHRVLMQLWSKEAPSELVVSRIPLFSSLLFFFFLPLLFSVLYRS